MIPVEFMYRPDNGKVLERVINLLQIGFSVFIMVAIYRSIKGSLGSMGGGKGGDFMGFGK